MVYPIILVISVLVPMVITGSTGKKLIEGSLKIRDRKTKEFLMGSYQSYLFNGWLSKRMELNHLLEKFTEAETEQVIEAS